MGRAVGHVLEAFQRQSADEHREAVAAILESVAAIESPPLDDELLARIAGLSFQDSAARETRDHRGRRAVRPGSRMAAR